MRNHHLDLNLSGVSAADLAVVVHPSSEITSVKVRRVEGGDTGGLFIDWSFTVEGETREDQLRELIRIGEHLSAQAALALAERETSSDVDQVHEALGEGVTA